MILFGSTFSQSSSTQLANRLARLAQFICQTLFMPSINWIVLSLNHFSGGFPCLVWIPQSLNTPLGFSHLAWGISTLNLEPLNLKHSFGVLTLSLRSFHAQHETYEPQTPLLFVIKCEKSPCLAWIVALRLCESSRMLPIATHGLPNQ